MNPNPSDPNTDADTIAESFDPPIDHGHERYLAAGKLTEPACQAHHDGLLCTRGYGHDGDHAAHGMINQQFRRWAQS